MKQQLNSLKTSYMLYSKGTINENYVYTSVYGIVVRNILKPTHMKLTVFSIIFSLLYLNSTSQNINKMFLLDLTDGSYVFVKDISEIELNEINDDKKSKREVMVSKNGINIDVYKLSNGKIISKYNEYYTVFSDSIDFIKATNDGYFDNNSSQSIMLKKNLYGERFPEYTEEMIQNLLKKLNLTTTVLDNNLLIKIENAINSMQNPFVFYRENFTAIIALLGEMLIRNNHRLKWKITLASDNVTWEPGIEGSDSRVHYIFSDLYEYLFFDNNIDAVLSEEYGTLRIIVR